MHFGIHIIQRSRMPLDHERSRDLNGYRCLLLKTSSSFAKEMSLPEYKFLDKTEDYECPICTLVLNSPVQTRCCGTVFCKSCIEQWRTPSILTSGMHQRGGASPSCCPQCRSSPLQCYDDKRTERMIKNLNVTCTNHKSGCKWTGELRNLSSHLSNTNTSGCQYQMVPCPRKCGENILRSQIVKHSVEACIHRKVQCKFCQTTGYYNIIIGKHYDECPKVTISCPNNCDTSSLMRSELQEHINQCPLQVVPCEYADAGCSQHMPRKDIEIHRITGMAQHLDLVNKKLSQLLEHLEYKDHIAPIIMKMSNFLKQETWSSPNFYTHCNGYKLQLKVSVKHASNVMTLFGAGSLSVSIVSVEGPFDEHLNWPMHARVNVRLLNQVHNSHHHSVTFQIERQRGKTAPHCVEQFIPYSKLSSQGNAQVKFLMNNSLYFQVLVELLGDCKPKPWLNSSLVLT